MKLSISKEKILRLKWAVGELAKSMIPVGKTKKQILSQGKTEIKFAKSQRYKMFCQGKIFLRVEIHLKGMPVVKRILRSNVPAGTYPFKLYKVKYDKNRTIPHDFELEVYDPERMDKLIGQLEEIGELENFYNDVADQYAVRYGDKMYESFLEQGREISKTV